MIETSNHSTGFTVLRYDYDKDFNSVQRMYTGCTKLDKDTGNKIESYVSVNASDPPSAKD